MAESQLYEAFLHLSQHSVDSVQNGMGFTDWDGYMHVDRPIEDKLMVKMDEIDRVGGGIILLIGSAGDGKSHLISRIKQMSDWNEHCFYNDATASSSPKKTAIDTLKEALVPFKDANLRTTTEKLVLAINLGKLNSFIEDETVKGEYTEIVNVTHPLFDDNTTPIETQRIKVVDFSSNKAFEFHPSNSTDYPVGASFLSSILEKVVEKSLANPFYQAYLKDKAVEKNKKDPLLFNYELLSIPEVRHTICMTIIEAIIRCKLNITPREFLDFIYSIVVFPRYSDYNEKRDFYEALLPTLLYCGAENTIQKAISSLDPLKHSSTKHDKQLSVLFTSYSIPKDYLPPKIKMPELLIQRTNEFYANNGRDIERTIKFVFRLNHLLSYHSEDSVYISYLSLLRGVFNKDTRVMQKIYDVVSKAIPRHYGSYYSKSNMIPLNIQGGRYRLFANLQLKPEPIISFYTEENPSEFLLQFDMKWKFPDGSITLRMDYQLYSYLYDLNNGKLALAYENEKDLSFSRFVRQLVEKCDCSDEITIIKSDPAVLKLTETAFGNIQLQ